jgi:hypothetical protein
VPYTGIELVTFLFEDCEQKPVQDGLPTSIARGERGADLFEILFGEHF